MRETDHHPSVLESISSPVPDNLFDAFIRGNTIMPQDMTGIICFTLKSLIEQEEIDLLAFAESALSEDQIDKLGKTMNSSHSAYGIKYNFRENSSVKNGHEVSTERLKEIWEKAKTESLLLLYKYFYPENSRYDTHYLLISNLSLIPEVAKKIEENLNDTDKSKDFRKVVKTSTDALTDKHGRLLTKMYRNKLKTSKEKAIDNKKAIRNYLRRQVEQKFTRGMDRRLRMLVETLTF